MSSGRYTGAHVHRCTCVLYHAIFYMLRNSVTITAYLHTNNAHKYTHVYHHFYAYNHHLYACRTAFWGGIGFSGMQFAKHSKEVLGWADVAKNNMYVCVYVRVYVCSIVLLLCSRPIALIPALHTLKP